MGRALRPDSGAKGSGRTFVTLDGMRGVAALSVVVFHAQTIAYHAAPILPSAYLAVDLFFVLSGFVLEHAYGARLAGDMSWARFIEARYIRLYPLYLLGALVGIASGATAWLMGAGELTAGGLMLASAAALLMLPSPTWALTGPLFVLNSPGWSLVYELGVNTLFAAIYRRLSRPLLIFLIVGSGAALVYSVMRVGYLDLGSAWHNALGGIPRVICAFFIGVLIRRQLSGSARKSWLAVPLLMLLAPIFLAGPGPQLRPWFDLAAALFVFPMLILLASRVEPGDWGTGTFEFLGRISYPIYAIHYPVLELARRAVNAAHLQSLYVPVAALTCLLLVWVSDLLVRRYDGPARAALARLLGRQGLARLPARATSGVRDVPSDRP